MFERFLYGLAFVDIVMLSLFYLALSKLSEVEIIKNDYVGFSLWLDFCFWIFATVGSVITYRSSTFETQFSQAKEFGKLLDRAIPLVMLTLILIFSIKYWP